MKKSNIKDFLSYLIVGTITTVTELVLFFVFDKLSLHYTLATISAHVVATFINWLMGRVLVFKENRQSVLKEIAEIYAASIVGLLLNLAIMWFAVDLLTFSEMFSKIVATVIVFFYNFLVRKLLIYKQR